MFGLSTTPWNAPAIPAYGLNTSWGALGVNTVDNGLPDAGLEWPPRPFDVAQKQFHIWNAWWANDIAELQNIYIQQNRVRPTAFAGGLVGRLQRFFWGRPNLQSNGRIHVPAASDLARTSADLLFAEPWTITPADGEAGGNELVKAGERLGEVFGNDETISTMLGGAELASALGGVYLRLWWDKTVSDRVMIDTTAADCAVPIWRYNRLVGVCFWRVVANQNGTWVRHLEKHVPGRIYHALYEGDQGQLGHRISLTACAETQWIAKIADKDGGIDTGVDTLTAAYVPNATPNRMWRNTPGLAQFGRSDFDGLETFLDALDEAYSSWMRDIDLGKARLFVDESLLQSEGPGSGATFDGEQEIFTVLRGGLGKLADGATSIQANQFAIRWQEHSQTCAELLNVILRGAGISTGSFSDTSLTVGVPTATEINSRDNLSERTRTKKINLWKAAVAPLMLTGMQIDSQLFGTGITLTEAPNVIFPTRSMQAPQELAQTLNLLAVAKFISTQQAVTELHPNWSDDQITEEVDRIKDEASQQGFAFDDGQNNNPFPPPSGGQEDDNPAEEDEPTFRDQKTENSQQADDQ